MSNLVLDEYPIVIQASLVRRLGIAEAALVQQLHYWSGRATRTHDGHTWVYKTYADWSQEIGLSTKACRGALDKLRRAGVVIAVENPTDARDHTLWWRIDYDVLGEGSQSAPQGSPTAREGISRAGVPGSTETTSTEMVESARTREASDPFQHCFAYWQERTGHPRAKPTADLRRKFQARLAEGFTVDDIRTGIDGIAVNGYVNERGVKHDDFELVVRNGEKLRLNIARASAGSLPENVRELPQNSTASERRQANEKRQMEILMRQAGMST